MRYVKILSNSMYQAIQNLIHEMISKTAHKFAKTFIMTKFKQYLEKLYNQQGNLLHSTKTLSDFEKNRLTYLELVNVLYEKTSNNIPSIEILLKEAKDRLDKKVKPTKTFKLLSKEAKQKMLQEFDIKDIEYYSQYSLYNYQSSTPSLLLAVKDKTIKHILAKKNKLPTDQVRIKDFINCINSFLSTRKSPFTVENTDLVKMGYYFNNSEIVPIDQVTDMKGFNLNLQNNHVVIKLKDGLQVEGLSINKNSNLTKLPENMVTDFIYGLEEKELKLPNNLRIRYLDLSRTSIKTLPENLTAGTLILNKYINKLPKSLKVTYKFDISESCLLYQDTESNVTKDTKIVDDEEKYRN